jgi:enoyl-CoA hydratase
MTTSRYVTIDPIADRIACLVIDSEPREHGLTLKVFSELEAAVTGLQSESWKAVILTGKGTDVFVPGLDFAELAQLGPVEARSFARRGQQVFEQLETLGIPVIAAVNGVALGAGCELALACTVRIASTMARFGHPEIAQGKFPAFGATQRLPRLIGRGRAVELLLTGETIPAPEAYRIGLVNRVHEPARLLTAAKVLAQRLTRGPGANIRYCLDAVSNGVEMSLQDGFRLEANLFGLCALPDISSDGD